MPHGSIVYLTFPTVQGLCRSCDRYVTTCPKEVHPDCHATWRLMRLVSSWASVATNSEVATMFEISDATVRRYDKIVLKADTPPPCFDGLRKLLIDEKSVRKGLCYVTIILNGETGELLHMQEGKKKESVESFFEQLAEEQRAGIVAVGIDRSGAYQAAVAAWLPNADIVYDRFHLVMNVNQAVDEVRRTQCRKASKEDRQLIKGQRYLILGNQENLDADARGKLDKLLEANEAISTAYILKEQFRWLFSYKRRGRRIRYYGTYSNKSRGQTPLIPGRIIRPPESSPNLKSPISNVQSTILLVPAPPKQSARDMRPGEDARLQDTRAKTRIRDFIGQVSRHANESLVAASL
jgi:hypothetical protein